MFFFKTYALDEKTGTLSLSYAYQEHTFTETILFPVPFPKISNAKKKALDRVCFLTHIACGISYFKAFLPKKIKIESGNLTKEEATFFREFYLKGLGEFSYRNKVHLENLVPALFKGTSIQKEPLDIPFTPSKVLIPVGGGKDSCLSMELFKQKTNKDVTAFSVGTAQPIMDCIKTAGVPHLCIKRTIAPELIKLNQTGTVYNGHIPITGIISFITWLCAIIYDYKYYDRHDKKNYNIKREQEIIFFGTEEMINQLKDPDNEQYFIDVTYKIIPFKYHPYKLLTMKAFNKKTKNTKLCILITIKYEEENSFYYIKTVCHH